MLEHHAIVSDAYAMARPTRAPAHPAAGDDETPPKCPICHRRLVMLAMHCAKDEKGASVRRQLWGCPRGHATAHRTRGRFSPIELLETLND